MQLKNYTSEFKTNIKLASPIVLGSLGHLLVGLVDDVMVGSLGPEYLAATSLANGIFFIALSIGLGVTFAITPLVAEAVGGHNSNTIKRTFSHGMFMSIVLGIVMTLFLFAFKPILQYLDQPEIVVKLAMPYYQIVTLSVIPLMIFQGLKQFADGLSLTKYGMHATIVTNVINILVNYFLIYGVWVFPRMELVGAGIGTLISRIVVVFVLWKLMCNNKEIKAYITGFYKEKILKIELYKIMNIGFPTALQMLFEVGLFTASILVAGKFGELSQAANQIALKLATTTYMISIGVGVATTIRVGNQKGLKDFEKLKTVAFSNFLLISIIMTFFTLLFMVFNTSLPYMFTSTEEVILIASKLLIIAGFFQLFDGLQAVILGALRGLQDVKYPMYITFFSYWVIGFPILWILSIHYNYQTFGVWIGLLFGLLTSSILLFYRFNKLTHRLIRKNTHDIT